MQLVYGTRVVEIAPAEAEWRKDTYRGKLRSRGSSLTLVDNTLRNLDLNPSVNAYNSLGTHFDTWYNRKQVACVFT